MRILSAKVLCCALFILGICCLAYADSLPQFFGVYLNQNGNFVEVQRATKIDVQKYNFHRRGGITDITDYNVMETTPADKFITIDTNVFNKEGFVVVQDPEWSEFSLCRVPHTGKWSDNENSANIVTAIGQKGSPMLQSDQGLDGKVSCSDEKISLKKGKKGDNAFIYVPSSPIEAGCYLIDYKVNGKGQAGWNPIRLR